MPQLLEPVSVSPNQAHQKYISTERAAVMLQVPQSYFEDLLAQSVISSKLVGGNRKVLLSELNEYKLRCDEAATKAFREMTQEAQAMGLY